MMRNVGTHSYVPARYAPGTAPGTVVVKNVHGVAATWAIARPVSSPTPKYTPPAMIARGSGVGFSPGRPNVEMDPSDQQTWQRQYRFTR